MAGDIKEGRPLIFKNKEELQNAINEYFSECQKHKRKVMLKGMDTQIEIDDPLIPTIAGLAYHLNIDRETVYNYEKRDEYFDTIKKARNYILSQIENKLVNSDSNVVGSIFIAKNYGYVDARKIEQTNINDKELSEEEKEKITKELLTILKNDING